jgi:hypothetical protein
MTDSKTIESAPKDGTPVLLWARLSSYPPEPDNYFWIVGFWHGSIARWKVAPEQLNAQEELIATRWAPLPKPPQGAQS